REVYDKGLGIILKLDVPGALNMRKMVNDAVLIFIRPPSMKILRQRLIERGTESLDKIEQRLSAASIEIQKSLHYNYVITNNEVSQAVDDLRCIIIAERLRQVPK
ncbi:MAG: guanylate kinase, partial [Bacteroidia bacterium]|nr:guanylate kinase [Bacteroidia bacterium]